MSKLIEARYPMASGLQGEDAVAEQVRLLLADAGARSFLDAGCGEGKYILRLRFEDPGLQAWALDFWPQALDEVAGASVKIQGRMPEVLSLIPTKAVDAVICLDAIEHLEKVNGRRSLVEFERIARKIVVVFTPLGFMPHEGDRPGKRHLSGWEPEDFEGSGYVTVVWKNFDYGPGNGCRDSLWAAKRLT